MRFNWGGLRRGAAGTDNATRAAESETDEALPDGAVADADGVVRLDVSHLPPPMPMLRILEALGRLPPGGTLHVRNGRRPIYLYPRLEALGCTHETTEHGPGHVELVIHKPLQS